MMKNIIKCTIKHINIRLVDMGGDIFTVILCKPHESSKKIINDAFKNKKKVKFPQFPSALSYNKASKRFFELVKQANSKQITFQ